MDRKPDESELFDFLEGSLPPEKHAEIKAYLESNPELLASVEAAKRGSEALNACKIGVSIDLTSEIMQKIEPSATPGSRASKLVLAVAGLALLAICLFFMIRPDEKQQLQPATGPDKLPQAPAQVIAQNPDTTNPTVTGQPEQAPTLVLASKEKRVISFPETGSITLNGPGRFEVTKSQARIIQGSARFDILPQNEDRPFRVSTEDTLIIVIGTLFEVEKTGSGTRVSLEHGTLRIEHGGLVNMLESGWTANIEGTDFVVSKISKNEFVQPAKDVTETPAVQINNKPVDETQQTPAASSQSPLDLLNEWSIQTPDTK